MNDTHFADLRVNRFDSSFFLLHSTFALNIPEHSKAIRRKQKAGVPFDPVLFAASVPSRKPTEKDIADTKAHEDDVIEFGEYGLFDKILDGCDR